VRYTLTPYIKQLRFVFKGLIFLLMNKISAVVMSLNSRPLVKTYGSIGLPKVLSRLPPV
jgi:hypothetical protein